jgi:aminobenzoyl-glutamate utilization protein B
MDKETLFRTIDERSEDLTELSRQVWENPELSLQENKSSKKLSDALEDEGFEIKYGAGDLPTAFVASYGSGSPVIGILGEYDALPGLSQSISAKRDPIEPGEPGHGCGHNLHGTGAVGGALAVKSFLANAPDSVDGTIKYFGCPAEEILVGKVYMAHDGVFNGLDAALAWHPSDLSSVRLGTANALNSIDTR